MTVPQLVGGVKGCVPRSGLVHETPCSLPLAAGWNADDPPATWWKPPLKPGCPNDTQ